jgi:hypothetical protein
MYTWRTVLLRTSWLPRLQRNASCTCQGETLPDQGHDFNAVMRMIIWAIAMAEPIDTATTCLIQVASPGSPHDSRMLRRSAHSVA